MGRRRKYSASLLRCDPLLSMLFNEDAQSGQSLVPPTDSSQTVVKVGLAVQSLGTLESDILSALYPSNGCEPESIEDIAARLGMSLSEVQNLADNALRGLRGSGFNRSSTAWN